MELSDKSGFNLIKEMTYSAAFNEYLHSKEFGKDICNLKSSDFDDEYIIRYVKKAFRYIDFYSK